MFRSHLALAILLVAPATLYFSFATPPTRVEEPLTPVGPSDPTAYFPTTTGFEWVYRVTMVESRRRDRTYEELDVITGVQDREGTTIVSCLQLKGDHNPYPVSEWALSNAGLRTRRLYREGQVGYPWMTILPSTVRPGETWTEELPDESTRSVATIRGWERITVKAGKFEAVRVDLTQTFLRGTDGAIRATFWYAPGIGLVRLEAYSGRPGFRMVWELVAFKGGR